MKRKNITRVAIWTGLIILIPLAFQLTIGTGIDGQGFNWKLGDFIIIAVLLFITGLAIDFVLRKITDSTNRFFAIVGIVILFLIVWAGMVHNVGERLIEKLFCGGGC